MQNFKLIEKLFTFENFQIEKFDHDFNGFLSRVIFLNYELSKKFLEREREICENVQQELLTKDDEILSLKNKISSLEQVELFQVFPLTNFRDSSKAEKCSRNPFLKPLLPNQRMHRV